LKTIILFRHGKADWRADFNPDHDRKLALQGIQEAKKMGKYLTSKNHIPDRVISSTAMRAKTTAELAMASGKWDSSFTLTSGIYGGDPLFLLNLVQSQDDHLTSICLVGHEPNFSHFIVYMTDNAHEHFPTASMVKIDFDVINWKDISPGFGKKDWLVRPKELMTS